MFKKTLLLSVLSASILFAETTITKQIGEVVTDVPLNGSIGNTIYDQITSLMGSNALAVDGANKAIFRIHNENIAKITDDIKATSSVTKGTDNVIGSTTANDEETNLFLKGFKQEGYDENGFYIGKLSAWAGGISKGYIYKSYLEVNSKDQKTYKVIEFTRVNFLDELTKIYADYYVSKKEVPLFIPAMDQYITGYYRLINEVCGLGTPPSGGSRSVADDNYLNSIHNCMLNNAAGNGRTFGAIKTLTKAQLDAVNSSPQTLQNAIRTKLATIKGTAGAFNGYGTDMFERNGFVLNYATYNSNSMFYQGYSNISDSNFVDIIAMHVGMASTVMTAHNIRNGYFVVQGGLPYEFFAGDNKLASPGQYVGTYWKKCKRKVAKKCLKYEHGWHGAVNFEADQLYGLQSYDYLNFTSHDANELLTGDFYEKQRIIPTLLPFADAVGAPKLSHQGHLLGHVVSFLGYGTAYSGGVNNNFLGINKEFGVMDAFGAMPAGFSANKHGGSGPLDNRFVGNQHKKSAWTWFAFFLLFILLSPIAAFTIGIAELGVILYLLYHPVHPGNVNYSNTNTGSTSEVNSLFAPSLKRYTSQDDEIIEQLKKSSVYNEVFAVDNTNAAAIFDTGYSQNIVSKDNNLLNSLSKLKNPNNNAWAIEADALSSKYPYSQVFGGMKDNGYNMFNVRFDNDVDLYQIISGYTKGN